MFLRAPAMRHLQPRIKKKMQRQLENKVDQMEGKDG
jgi:hypothetical protein